MDRLVDHFETVFINARGSDRVFDHLPQAQRLAAEDRANFFQISTGLLARSCD